MIIEVICVMFLSYLFYRQGMKQLFRSYLFENRSADHFAYAFFMLTGLLLGMIISFSLFTVILIHINIIIVATFALSIFIGEYLYYKNKNMISRTIKSSRESKEKHNQ